MLFVVRKFHIFALFIFFEHCFTTLISNKHKNESQRTVAYIHRVSVHQVGPVWIIWQLNKLDICYLLAKFQNRTYLGTCFTYKQNMQFCEQNMVISLIFGLLKVHSSTNKYFYEKRILYMK
jgi:hypothetical protein